MTTVAIAGLGGRGLKQLEHLLDRPGWDVVAVADRSPIAYAALQAELYERRIPFLRDASGLAEYRPEAVVVSTTAAAHVPVALALVEAGYPGAILIEKPLSTSIAAARRLLDMAPARVAVDFQRRGSPLYAEVAALVSSGGLGALQSIAYTAPAPTELSMNGSHQIDVANWLAASEPVSVTATLGEPLGGRRGAGYYDPPGRADVRYAGGVRFSIDTTGAGETHGLVVACEGGELRVPPGEAEAHVRTPEGERTIAGSGDQFDWFERTLHALVDGGDGAVPCTLEEAAGDLEVVAGAFLSDRRGGAEIALPLTGDDAEVELRVA
jgi:predicted dehydrogenase